MANPVERAALLPSTSTFSFSAPFPLPASASASSAPSPFKQRRVSLALPSSPRLFPAFHFRDDTGVGVYSGDPSSSLQPEKKGKMRRIESGSDRPDEDVLQLPSEKKIRKKWTAEETQMLVDGCNKWGVGNWKSILNDPQFKFDGRSPVDLKDRFRTYFPDAYKQHYPNARTHLSSKIRSALPDGSSIFEKTRSKKRRPFTEEEDRALKAGYDKHGTVWATIVKDPIFQEQNRRSTDLRDRFRNAFPDLYEAAGYKPRASAKKKQGSTVGPLRAATDDQLASPSSSAGPIRKRRYTTQGLYRGGTKSVPESTTCSEDEDSSDGEEDALGIMGKDGSQTAPPEEIPATVGSETYSTEVDMQADTLADSSSINDFIPGPALSEITDSSQSQAWTSGLDTPLHSGPWAANAASPTSSNISSEYFSTQSPFHRRPEGPHTMIGKSAWGPQDWLSANPRLEPSAAPSSNSSFLGGVSPTPSSPFSFAQLNHGVLDRYDLFPPSLAHDFASEAGIGDTHSTFSDPDMVLSSSFRGFTHHSNYAGDLIFGARTHQPQQPFEYGLGFGFGSAGLGLSGVQQLGLPLHSHTPALPGIDEIELTSITLDDQSDVPAPMDAVDTSTAPKGDTAAGMDLASFGLPSQTLDEIVGLTLPHEFNATPPGTPQTTSRSMRSHSHLASSHNRSVSVPPSEHRSAVPRAPQTQLLKPRPLHASPRPFPLMDVVPMHAPPVEGMSMQLPQTYQPGPSYPADGWRPQGDLYDLPFLDLHYYSSHHGITGTGMDDGGAPNVIKPDMDIARQGQALDLAQTYTSTLRGVLPPVLPQHISMMPQSAASTPPVSARMVPMHHRGQSAVSPQDLLLRKSNENKRKRSSWDGGIH